MFFASKPQPAEVERFLRAQHDAKLSYPPELLGATRSSQHPSRFSFDHRRTTLGRGEADFDRAKIVLRAWRHFGLGWVNVHDPAAPLAVGQNVALIIHTLGVWALSAARIVYVIDEPRRFGYAYGTLESHLECGEERFLIEWTGEDEVVYDLSAFSRPRHLLLRLGYPFTRSQQKRFARESSRQLALSIRGADPRPAT